MSKLLTIKEIADLVGVKYRTVQRWMERGEIAFIKLPGGDVRMKPEHLENWLNKRTIKAKS